MCDIPICLYPLECQFLGHLRPSNRAFVGQALNSCGDYILSEPSADVVARHGTNRARSALLWLGFGGAQIMSKLSDEYRAQAKKARATAESIDRRDMRETALEIARGWERMAEMVEREPKDPDKAEG